MGISFYHDESCTIFNGDALNVMLELPDESIDIILTDPPYGIAWKSGRRKTAPIKNDQSPAMAMNIISGALFIAKKKLKKRGVLVMFGPGGGKTDMDSGIIQYLNEDRNGFAMEQQVVWDKGLGVGFKYRQCTEYVYIARRFDGEMKWEHTEHGEEVGNIISMHRKVGGSNGKHPTPKPVELIERFLKLHGKPGDVVLDPFLGGGSTLVACKKMGMTGIGVEIDESYCEIAARALDETSYFPRHKSVPAPDKPSLRVEWDKERQQCDISIAWKELENQELSHAFYQFGKLQRYSKGSGGLELLYSIHRWLDEEDATWLKDEAETIAENETCGSYDGARVSQAKKIISRWLQELESEKRLIGTPERYREMLLTRAEDAYKALNEWFPAFGQREKAYAAFKASADVDLLPAVFPAATILEILDFDSKRFHPFWCPSFGLKIDKPSKLPSQPANPDESPNGGRTDLWEYLEEAKEKLGLQAWKPRKPLKEIIAGLPKRKTSGTLLKEARKQASAFAKKWKLPR